MGDRADVFFAIPEEISGFITQQMPIQAIAEVIESDWGAVILTYCINAHEWRADDFNAGGDHRDGSMKFSTAKDRVYTKLLNAVRWYVRRNWRKLTCDRSEGIWLLTHLGVSCASQQRAAAPWSGAIGVYRSVYKMAHSPSLDR